MDFQIKMSCLHHFSNPHSLIPSKSRVRRCSLLFVYFLSSIFNSQVWGADADDPNLKAAILYKLSQFIEWPNLDPKAVKGQFNLCLLGKSPLGNYLEPLNSRKIHRHKIGVLYFKNSDNIKGKCHLVFVSKTKKAFLTQIIKNLADSPTLTISDIGRFATNGGMIELSSAGKRLTFKINLNRTKQAGLKIAAPLLDMATLVQDHK